MSVVDLRSSTRADVLRDLRVGTRFLLVTHENPDGDALGSLIAMHGLLEALGKNVVTFIPPEEFPLPYEYAWLTFEDLAHELPADLHHRTIVFLDCGNADRNPLNTRGAHVLNIDHHHDNTHFGKVNHVVADASCTAEIVWDLMGALEVEPTSQMADALYVGLVTDTGRFMYENTGTRAHLMAAALIDAGVDVHEIYRRLYEGVPDAKLRLLARALGSVGRYDAGALTLARLSREDFAAAGAEEALTEGIVDHLRAVQGTRVAALVRELTGDDRRGLSKVSLRATDGSVDVSLIARLQGGGGHRQAAGFTTEMDVSELVAFLRDALAAQLAPA